MTCSIPFSHLVFLRKDDYNKKPVPSAITITTSGSSNDGSGGNHTAARAPQRITYDELLDDIGTHYLSREDLDSLSLLFQASRGEQDRWNNDPHRFLSWLERTQRLTIHDISALVTIFQSLGRNLPDILTRYRQDMNT
jgi:hypothetical protein